MMTGSPRPTSSAARIVNGMSVDVEDYFHVSALASVAPRERWAHFECRVEANTDRLLEIFERTGVTATFFVLGWVAERFPSLVGRIAAAGHEVASHGYWHQLVYELTPASFGEDVRRTKELLEDQCGAAVLGYRAPSYSITRQSLWALDVLLETGYRYDASIFPIHHDRYGIPDAPRHAHALTRPHGQLAEVPPATVRLGAFNLPMSGGGYFRLLPYAWTRWGIAHINAHERQPAVFYLHPWELDPSQPRLPVSGLSRLRHYRNLHLTGERLEQLLGEFAFGPLKDLALPWLADAPSKVAV